MSQAEPILLLTRNKDFGIKCYNQLTEYKTDVNATLYLDLEKALNYLKSNKSDLIIAEEGVYKNEIIQGLNKLKIEKENLLVLPDNVFENETSEKFGEMILKLNSFFNSEENNVKAERVKKPDILGIGASTGGPAALLDLFSELNSNLSFPIVMVNHIPSGDFAKSLADSLCYNSNLKVSIAQTGVILQKGHAYLCPGGKHMIIQKVKGKKQYYPVITDDAPVNACKPSIDKMFESLSHLKFTDVAVAVLTGMGRDGTKGAKAVSKAQGCVYAQDPEECLIKSMPISVVESGICSKALILSELSYHINKGLFSFGTARNETVDVSIPVKEVNSTTAEKKPKLRQSNLGVNVELLENFKNLLRKEAQNTGYSETVFTLKRKLEPLLEKFDLNSYQALYDQSIRRTVIRQAVIDTLTNHETFFFRDKYPYEFIQNVFVPEKIKTGRTASIWSAACSTGQEPYSIALALTEAAKERSSLFSLMATDISRASVDKAKSGEYTRSEINRGLPEKFKKYLLNKGETFKIAPEVRRLIKFQAMNLFSKPTDFPSFDLIFLRYVLIYFDDDKKQKVLSSIIKNLKPNGYMILDPATSLKVRDDRVKPLKYKSQTIFIKKG